MSMNLAQHLFEPYGITRFAREHWSLHRPFAMEAPAARIAELTTLAQWTSTDALLATSPRHLKAWITQGTKFRAVRNLDTAQASKLWGTGLFTLVVDHVDQEMPVVRALLLGISRALGLDADVHANVYCAPPGLGSRAHFDCQEVIIVQLAGQKRWRYCGNDHVAFPLDSYFGHYGARLRRQLEGALPDVLPDHAEEVVLRPGSVLFLPRGTWHETRAEGDAESIAITLTFESRTWLGLLSQLVEEASVPQPELRRPLPLLGSDEDVDALRVALRERIEQLARLLADPSSSALLARHFGFDLRSRYRLNGALELRERDGQLALDAGAPESRLIPLAPALAPLGQWLATTPPFTLDQAAHASSSSLRATVALLAELRDQGLLSAAE